MRSTLVALLCVAIAAPVSAQARSTTHGFALGLHLDGVDLDPEDEESGTGGGLGLDLVYGFRSGLSIFLTLAGSVIEEGEGDETIEYDLGLADLGVRYAFGSEQARWRPFIEGALTGMIATWENIDIGDPERYDLDLTGGGVSVGGGVQYFFTPSFAFDGGVRLTFGSFTEVSVENVSIELDESIQARVTRVQLGLRYHFAR